MTPYKRGYAKAVRELADNYDALIIGIEKYYSEEIANQAQAFLACSDASAYDKGYRDALESRRSGPKSVSHKTQPKRKSA